MRYFNKILIALCFAFSSQTVAVNGYADFLLWQPSESAEWALINNCNPTNQIVSYQTIGFHVAPGFRFSLGHDINDHHGRLIYTHLNACTTNSINAGNGAIVSAFEVGKFIQKFSSSACVNFTIKYNILDADYYTDIKVKEKLIFRPIIGLKGGWIYQNINTYFQGGLDDNTLVPNQNYFKEKIVNNFSGLGPKIGVETQYFFSEKKSIRSSFFANLSTAFLWGNWVLCDVGYKNNSPQINQMLVGPRDFGAFMISGTAGYKFIILL